MSITIPIIAPAMKVHKINIPTPSVPKVSGEDVATVGRTAAGYLPPKDQLAYYTGLGALAVVGVIEWPVAAVIGVGMAIAKRSQAPSPWKPTLTEKSKSLTEESEESEEKAAKKTEKKAEGKSKKKAEDEAKTP